MAVQIDIMLLPLIEFDLYYHNVGNNGHIWTTIVELLDGTFVLILVFFSHSFIYWDFTAEYVLRGSVCKWEKQLFGVAGCT